MVNEIAVQHPKGDNGLTLPLRTLLASPDLKAHRAMLAMELEVLAMKTDRFGWERERGNPIQDRLITDWMDALQDFPLDEVKAAITACLDDRPGKMPNERDVLFQVHKDRARQMLLLKAEAKAPPPEDPERRPATAEERARIMKEVGFSGYTPKRMQGD
jgi:hypothetical protein